LIFQFTLGKVLSVKAYIPLFDVRTPQGPSLKDSLYPPLPYFQSFRVPPLYVTRLIQLHGQLLLSNTTPPRCAFGPSLAAPLDYLALASLLLRRCHR
jgi:hypothetical protein